MGEIEEKIKGKIPKDLRRWLKDNGHFVEFMRLINVCGYKISDLSFSYFDKDLNRAYSIIRWFNIPIRERRVHYNNGIVRYDTFLEFFDLNWKQE